MTSPPQDALLGALVDLADSMDSLNAVVRTQAETRLGQLRVSAIEVAVLRRLLRGPEATLEDIGDATGEPLPGLARALAALTRRGLVRTCSPAGARRPRYRATAAAVALHDGARDRASHHLRYALAALTADELRRLRESTGALAALSRALGFGEIHPDYRTAVGPGAAPSAAEVEPGGSA